MWIGYLNTREGTVLRKNLYGGGTAFTFLIRGTIGVAKNIHWDVGHRTYFVDWENNLGGTPHNKKLCCGWVCGWSK